MRQTDVVARGGPNRATLSLIERAQPGPYQPRTLTALDRALEWKPGTCQSILDGTNMPEFEVSPETKALVARDDTAQAGLAFLELVHRHYGAEQLSGEVNTVVTRFLREILSREHS